MAGYEEGTQADHGDDSSISVQTLLESLQQRADTLIRELKEYQNCLRQHNKAHEVELRTFRRGSESEAKSLLSHSLENASETPSSLQSDGEAVERRKLHVLRSSNLPFYEAIWETAKRCSSVTALGKRVYWDPLRRHASKREAKVRKPSVLIDIVSDRGLLWTKVSIVTPKRLLFDIAKEGWEKYDEASDHDSERNDDDSPLRQEDDGNDHVGSLELVKLARQLTDAARSVRVKYEHPRVRFVLPNLRDGEQKDIDAMIVDIKATGAIVECGRQQVHEVSEHDSFESMMPCSMPSDLTPDLNIDCTILLALISDISHLHRNELPACPSNESGTYHAAIMRQVKAEEGAPLLPSELYPILAERRLVCTSHAAQRMREIVLTMGTEDEQARAGILLGEAEFSGLSTVHLREAWIQRSSHVAPTSLQLPITIFDVDLTQLTVDDKVGSEFSLPSSPSFPWTVASKLVERINLSTINLSVFIFGWRHMYTTVTSNRVVAAGIEKQLNHILDEMENAKDAVPASIGPVLGQEFAGPKIWVCGTARSLIGKEKQSNGSIKTQKVVQ